MRFVDDKIECDKLVVGGSLASHLFSYLYKVPLVAPELEEYFPYEKIEENKKENILNSLSFILSLKGLKPFSNLSTNLLWEDNNELRIIINNRSTQHLHFNKLYIFEPHHIRGIDFKYERNICLIDIFQKVFCESHTKKSITSTEEKFLKEIHFVGPTKVFGVSEIKEKELQREEHSEYLSKFKLRHLLEQHGLSSGIKHRRVRFDHIKRVKRYKYLSATTAHQNVEFVYKKEEELWKQIEYSIQSELSQLKRGNPYLDMLGTIL